MNWYKIAKDLKTHDTIYGRKLYDKVVEHAALFSKPRKPNNKEELIILIKKNVERYGNCVDLNDVDTSNITNMSGLFSDVPNFNGKISSWNVSNVTDMRGMFNGCKLFNKSLRGWNTSKVTDMSYMFRDCRLFTGEGLETFDTSNVTYTAHMFENCISFNFNFDTTNTLGKFTITPEISKNSRGLISNILNLFKPKKKRTVKLVAPIPPKPKNLNPKVAQSFLSKNKNWGLEQVVDMSFMFANCLKFEGKGLNCVGSQYSENNKLVHNNTFQRLTYADGIFYNCVKFNGYVGQSEKLNWYTPQLSSMKHAFFNCKKFNIDIFEVDTNGNLKPTFFPYKPKRYYYSAGNERVYDCFEGTFQGCTEFNQNIQGLAYIKNCLSPNTEDNKYTLSCAYMFTNCYNFDGNGVAYFPFSKLRDGFHLFDGCTELNFSDIKEFDVSNLVEYGYMFNDCKNLNYNITPWFTNKTHGLSGIDTNDTYSTSYKIRTEGNFVKGCERIVCEPEYARRYLTPDIPDIKLWEMNWDEYNKKYMTPAPTATPGITSTSTPTISSTPIPSTT